MTRQCKRQNRNSLKIHRIIFQIHDTTSKHENREHNNSLWDTFLSQENATKPEVPGGFSRTAKIPATLDGHVSIVDVLERAPKSAAQPLLGYKLTEQHAKLKFARRRRRVEQFSEFAGSSRRSSIEWQLQGEQRWDTFFRIILRWLS